jgi:hypothetical protein
MRASVIFCAPAQARWRAQSGRLVRLLSVSSAHIFQPWLLCCCIPITMGIIISHNNRRTSSL